MVGEVRGKGQQFSPRPQTKSLVGHSLPPSSLLTTFELKDTIFSSYIIWRPCKVCANKHWACSNNENVFRTSVLVLGSENYWGGPDRSVKSFIRGKFDCRLAKVLVNSLTWLKLQPEFDQCQTESARKPNHWCLSVQTKASPLALPPLLFLHVCVSLSHTPGSSLFFICCSLSVFLSLLEGTGSSSD